ncbi:conserved hypothetical protein [Candidatus Protochlamydia naegleriophila]|uniref:Uncharacterized protein n=1 Tax=Candidatus Protochlamydia naegleriophila TaxID=389348 RepID=A0A0U5J6R9_9BACT|nr:hypothetical protein [Candidatus Protochlamydia naegleriophila]CUI15753.1 conserved hypothetical protein [Candidatus Protochlamydia naegleriophila]
MRIFLGLLLIPSLLMADLTWKGEEGSVAMEISIHPDKLVLDDVIYVEASFRYPKNYALDVNTLTSQLAGFVNPLQPRLAIIQSHSSPIEDNESHRQQSLSLMIAPLEKGSLSLSFLNVLFKPLDGSQPIELFTPVFQVEILPPSIINRQVLPIGPLLPLEPQFPLSLSETNRQALYQDAGQLEELAKHNEYILSMHSFPWIKTLILICLALGWWGLILLRRTYQLKAQEEASHQAPRITALQALKGLNDQQLPQQGLFKPFYTQLSELVLTFLEEYFSMPFKPFTTQELRERLLVSHLPSKQAEELLALLKRADEVKFTDQARAISEWKADEELVAAIIRSPLELDHKPPSASS